MKLSRCFALVNGTCGVAEQTSKVVALVPPLNRTRFQINTLPVIQNGYHISCAGCAQVIHQVPLQDLILTSTGYIS